MTASLYEANIQHTVGYTALSAARFHGYGTIERHGKGGMTMDESVWEGNRNERPHARSTSLERSSHHVAAWHDNL